MGRTAKNRKLAWKHFYPEGNGKAKQGYVLHHKDETLRHENPDRYNEWNPEDLVMMTKSEHILFHNIWQYMTEDTFRKISESNKKRIISEETRRKIGAKSLGRFHSDDTKRKMSDSHMGLLWWNNGNIEVRGKEQPEGFARGRIIRRIH